MSDYHREWIEALARLDTRFRVYLPPHPPQPVPRPWGFDQIKEPALRELLDIHSRSNRFGFESEDQAWLDREIAWVLFTERLRARLHPFIRAGRWFRLCWLDTRRACAADIARMRLAFQRVRIWGQGVYSRCRSLWRW